MTRLPVNNPRVQLALSKVGAMRSRRQAGRMNDTERRYADHLELLRRSGEILDYRFEAVGIRLAPRTFFYPDFLVVLMPGRLRFDEIKGHIRDDALDRFKIAAELYPWFDWRMLKWQSGQWEIVRQV